MLEQKKMDNVGILESSDSLMIINLMNKIFISSRSHALLVLKFIMKYCKNILKISSQLISKRFSFVAIEVICISVDQN